MKRDIIVVSLKVGCGTEVLLFERYHDFYERSAHGMSWAEWKRVKRNTVLVRRDTCEHLGEHDGGSAHDKKATVVAWQRLDAF